jgi:phage gpG-like protein
MSFSVKNAGGEVSGDFSRLENLIKELEKEFYVDVGILGETNTTTEGGYTLAGIGAVHEFGTDKAGRGRNVTIPERSFIKMPLETGQEQIEKAVKDKFQELMEKGDIKRIFQLIGLAAEGRIQEAFETGGFGEWPALRPSTIARKGSDAILIDDGSLRKAITSKVGGG